MDKVRRKSVSVFLCDEDCKKLTRRARRSSTTQSCRTPGDRI